MANVAKLKDKARAAENRDQWREAVTLYREFLETAGGEDTDIALWNRVGDLHLRLEETDRAVQAYEEAVDAYAESGLYNNAIALCRKILRLVPGRGVVYLKLGRISAASGFLADARQNFLEYATRMRRSGQLDASFEALKEFADLSPGDPEIRRLLADQLLAHDHRDEAVEQLRILLGILLDAGEAPAADEVREQIRLVDPEADASPLHRTASQPPGGDAFDDAYTTGAGRGAPPLPEIGERPPPPPEADAVEGLETASGFETGRYEDDAAAADLPPLGLDPLEIEHTSLIPDEARPDPDVAEAPGEGEDFAEEEDADPLPLLDFDEPLPAGAGTSLDALRAHVAEHPEDREAWERLVDELRGRGEEAEVSEVLQRVHRALAAQGRFLEAVAPVTELIRMNPGDGALLQKRVEYAFRAGDRGAQVNAYLELGRHLVTRGDAAKSKAVFQRVLELDPGNDEAREAMAAAAPAAPAAPEPGPASGGDDYVDLGALILGERDTAEPTTRFVVEEREPSGDEDRDFADMLSHFRQKVAENIEAEDSSSHYDLGVAFKEMGLVDEAIAEFQVALRGGADPLATLEMLGQCFFEKGQNPIGSRVLERALRLPEVTDADLVGVLYLLGRIQERTGEPGAALEYYERVVAVDIRFRDTAQRIEALRAASF